MYEEMSCPKEPIDDNPNRKRVVYGVFRRYHKGIYGLISVHKTMRGAKMSLAYHCRPCRKPSEIFEIKELPLRD